MIRRTVNTLDIPRIVRKIAYRAQKFAAAIRTPAAVLPDSTDLISQSRSCQVTYEHALNVAAKSKTTAMAMTRDLLNRLILGVA
jgi:hypothetical protein